MTVASSTNRVDYTGNGSTTVFSFTFRIFAATDLVVTESDASGVETVLTLNTDYTVTGVGSYAGGSITLGSALATGNTMTIQRVLPLTQETDLRNQGQFFAETHEDAFDRMAMVAQQLQEQIDRAVKSPVTSEIDPDALLDELLSDVASAADSADAAQNYLDLFRGQYYGVLSSDPIVDPLGNPSGAGDLYWSSSLSRMRVFDGSAWVDTGVAVPVTVNVQRFSGDGSTTVFTLTNAPAFQNACEVYISGVAQVPGVDYTITGAGLTTLTFTSAPVSGADNIFTRSISEYAGGVPNDGSVTTTKLVDGSVTAAKLATDSVTADKIAASAVGSSEIATGAVTDTKIGTGAVTVDKIGAAAVTAAKLDGAQSGTAPIYAARAWVSFNGTGTVAIRASGNVSSITDNGTGEYTVNFSTAMSNANYAVNALTDSASSGQALLMFTRSDVAYSTAAVAVALRAGNAVAYDASIVNVAIFR